MNRITYTYTMQSIRANGVASVARWAAQSGDLTTLAVCDLFANIAKQTDWLALRARWNRIGEDSKATTILLTCSDKIAAQYKARKI